MLAIACQKRKKGPPKNFEGERLKFVLKFCVLSPIHWG